MQATAPDTHSAVASPTMLAMLVFATTASSAAASAAKPSVLVTGATSARTRRDGLKAWTQSSDGQSTCCKQPLAERMAYISVVTVLIYSYASCSTRVVSFPHHWRWMAGVPASQLSHCRPYPHASVRELLHQTTEMQLTHDERHQQRG